MGCRSTPPSGAEEYCFLTCTQKLARLDFVIRLTLVVQVSSSRCCCSKLVMCQSTSAVSLTVTDAPTSAAGAACRRDRRREILDVWERRSRRMATEDLRTSA